MMILMKRETLQTNRFRRKMLFQNVIIIERYVNKNKALLISRGIQFV